MRVLAGALPGPGRRRQTRLQDTARRPFGRVPTHVIGVAEERRQCARAYLRLPLRLVGVEGRREPVSVTLLTQNISSSGVLFLSPRPIPPGTAIELEVGLVDRPLGRGSVRMTTDAHVVRAEPAATPGWHGIAARFDDFDFRRDESLPLRFRKP
ncbi:MAG TPA: PilZ domain-containing protein [Verrucomicrobiae bacterium]|nr:PilZ domain-containing protein [Verrucomicrobiae bacterium]